MIGGSGSGKTWLSAKLQEKLGDHATSLCLDAFYRDLSHLPPAVRSQVNFDDPAAIDWDALRAVLESLEHGHPAAVPVYDFATHTRQPTPLVLAPKAIVIIEGLWLFHPPWLRQKFAHSVFVDCPADERLRRRIERDVLTRGRSETSVRDQFANHVQPMHERFVEPQRHHASLQLQSPVADATLDQLVQTCLVLQTD